MPPSSPSRLQASGPALESCRGALAPGRATACPRPVHCTPSAPRPSGRSPPPPPSHHAGAKTTRTSPASTLRCFDAAAAPGEIPRRLTGIRDPKSRFRRDLFAKAISCITLSREGGVNPMSGVWASAIAVRSGGAVGQVSPVLLLSSRRPGRVFVLVLVQWTHSPHWGGTASPWSPGSTRVTCRSPTFSTTRRRSVPEAQPSRSPTVRGPRGGVLSACGEQSRASKAARDFARPRSSRSSLLPQRATYTTTPALRATLTLEPIGHGPAQASPGRPLAGMDAHRR